MKQRPGFESCNLFRRESKHFTHAGCVNLHASNMAMRGLIFSVDRRRQGFRSRKVKAAQRFNFVGLGLQTRSCAAIYQIGCKNRDWSENEIRKKKRSVDNFKSER